MKRQKLPRTREDDTELPPLGTMTWNDTFQAWFNGCKVGKRVAERWKTHAGSPESRLLALAVADRLSGIVFSPMVRWGFCQDQDFSEMDMYQGYDDAKEAADNYYDAYGVRVNPVELWAQLCIYVERQYLLTQMLNAKTWETDLLDNPGNKILFRGVSGPLAEIIWDIHQRQTQSCIPTRVLESWTSSLETAVYFSFRDAENTATMILAWNPPLHLLFCDAFTSEDTVNADEEEVLVITAGMLDTNEMLQKHMEVAFYIPAWPENWSYKHPAYEDAIEAALGSDD